MGRKLPSVLDAPACDIPAEPWASSIAVDLLHAIRKKCVEDPNHALLMAQALRGSVCREFAHPLHVAFLHESMSYALFAKKDLVAAGEEATKAQTALDKGARQGFPPGCQAWFDGMKTRISILLHTAAQGENIAYAVLPQCTLRFL